MVNRGKTLQDLDDYVRDWWRDWLKVNRPRLTEAEVDELSVTGSMTLFTIEPKSARFQELVWGLSDGS